MQRRDNRLTVKRLSISKGYLESAFELLAYFEALHHPSGETIYRQAIFNWSNPAICHRKKRRTISPCDHAVWYPSKVKDWVQDFMLIAYIEIINGPKSIVSSVVRLQRPKYIDDIWGGAVNVPLFDGIFKVLPISTERKVNVFDISSVDSNQVAGEEIESRSEIVNSVSYYRRKIVRNLVLGAYNKKVIKGLTILLNDNSIRISCNELSDLTLKLTDVLLGPFNL
jgi:hypothetical protein